MLLPVADILLIEERTCAHCANTFSVPSPTLYRLYKAPTNEPEKLELRALKAQPSTAAEEEHLHALPRRAVHRVSISVPNCQFCFTHTHPYAEVAAIRPVPEHSLQNAFAVAYQRALSRDASAPKAAKPSARPTVSLDDIAASLGL